MSTDSSTRFGDGSRRGLALAAALLLVASYLSVLQHVTDVTGQTNRLILVVAGSLVAATLLARFLPTVVAVLLAAVAFAAGLWWYVQAVPDTQVLLQSFDAVRADVLSLLTGLSILRIMAAGIWAVGFAPAPTFLTWYLALRRRYVGAAVVGGAALGFFVLTGDAGAVAVLAGVVGAAGLVGFGELDRYGGSARQAETLLVVLAAMVVIAPFVTVVPGGAAQPLVPSGAGSGSGGTGSLEGGLLAAGDQVTVQGAISLSPKVRFSVESNHRDYWRVAGYDRYTGSGWVRTGAERDYDGSLAGPPGNTTSVTQQYTIESPVGVLPAAWKPISVSGSPAANAKVTDLSGLQPGNQLENGTTYTVESERPNASASQLRSAGTDYPNAVANRYTQLPASTPNRVARRTATITANAEDPYDKARTIERWLQRTKGYSLNVSKPSGNIADSFLFEMNEGYCTYFATTMVTMLRTQGIPARFVTGYTDGQRVSQDQWVVRGYDSHAWVEVYFPDTGWVRFDPTPAGPRHAAEQDDLQNARSNDVADVDAGGSAGGEWMPSTPTPTPTATLSGGNRNASGAAGPDRANANEQRRQLRQAAQNGQNGGGGQGLTAGVAGVAGADGAGTTSQVAAGSSGSGFQFPSPTRRQTAFVLVVLVGLAAAGRRSGLFGRAYRELWLRVQPSGSPAEETERAFERLEYLLGREYRPRRSGETPKHYLRVVGADDRAVRVGALYERAHYAGDVSREEADEAVSLVDELVAERTPVLGRFRRSRRGPDSI